MTRKRRTQVWKIWRWPVLSVLLGLLLLGFIPIAADDIVDALRSKSALGQGQFCESGDGCIQRIPGRLIHVDNGGLSKSNTAPTWEVGPTQFDVTRRTSRQLDPYEGQWVIAYVESDLVRGIESSDGKRFESVDAGWYGAASALTTALLCFGFALFALDRGLGARRMSSWLSTLELRQGIGGTRFYWPGMATFGLGIFFGLPLFFGAPLWGACALGAVGIGLIGFTAMQITRMEKRLPGQHSA